MLLIFSLAYYYYAVVGIESGEFTKTTDCTCPGGIVTYNCNITGRGFTIWRGSAFDCEESRIILRHASFSQSGGTTGRCSDGAIIAHSLGMINNNLNKSIYMSQLIVNLNGPSGSNIIGQTVNCVYRNTDGLETTIGSTTIEIVLPG